MVIFIYVLWYTGGRAVFRSIRIARVFLLQFSQHSNASEHSFNLLYWISPKLDKYEQHDYTLRNKAWLPLAEYHESQQPANELFLIHPEPYFIQIVRNV
jgi:hypothetical protein